MERVHKNYRVNVNGQGLFGPCPFALWKRDFVNDNLGEKTDRGKTFHNIQRAFHDKSLEKVLFAR